MVHPHYGIISAVKNEYDFSEFSHRHPLRDAKFKKQVT